MVGLCFPIMPHFPVILLHETTTGTRPHKQTVSQLFRIAPCCRNDTHAAEFGVCGTTSRSDLINAATNSETENKKSSFTPLTSGVKC